MPEDKPSRAADTILRVRYSETDQMGTFYNSRALEWFECARTALLRELDVPYTIMEDKGALLPIVEAHVEYTGRARYDDELKLTATAHMVGKARVRFDIEIVRTDGAGPIAKGYTVHVVTNPEGRPIRAPEWFTRALDA